MELVELSSGRVSLELASNEVDWVVCRLRIDGASLVRHSYYDLFLVGGEEVIFMDEWDDPCFISVGPGGDTLLRQIASDRTSPTQSD